MIHSVTFASLKAVNNKSLFLKTAFWAEKWMSLDQFQGKPCLNLFHLQIQNERKPAQT